MHRGTEIVYKSNTFYIWTLFHCKFTSCDQILNLDDWIQDSSCQSLVLMLGLIAWASALYSLFPFTNISTLKGSIHIMYFSDVKPSNILLDRGGCVKLCDFGISGRLVDSKAKTRSAGCAAYMAVRIHIHLFGMILFLSIPLWLELSHNLILTPASIVYKDMFWKLG